MRVTASPDRPARLDFDFVEAAPPWRSGCVWLAGARREAWLPAQPVRECEAGSGSRREAGGLAVLGLQQPLGPDEDPAAVTESLYRALFARVRPSAQPYLIRIWNFFGAINAGPGDEERYRRFCVGRNAAVDAMFRDPPPAATAIGAPRPDAPLSVVALCSAEPALALENPRQTPAWQYPREYGPVPPGFSRGAVVGKNLRLGRAGLAMNVRTDWGDAEIEAPLLGRFNAANLLAALAALLISDVGLNDACAALAHVAPPPGRVETLGGGSQPLVVVDYAHSPDALEKVLAALRETLEGGRLVCVFGCGGNRDRGKRPLMGEAAAKAADEIWITSDNPRHESPQAIIDDILVGALRVGAKQARHVEIDRARAIFEAVGGAHQGDVVLIAGKGHEDYQEIGDERHPFSDTAVARKALAAWT